MQDREVVSALRMHPDILRPLHRKVRCHFTLELTEIRYPSIPQGPDPSGFRQQCPHCQELCTCARCRQRRMEEATPAKARAARSVLKRQHSEEDEEYVSKEDLATAALMHTEVRREALRKDSDFDDDDGCGSWKADDLSLSPLRPSSSSSSCGSRLKFMGSDDSSVRFVSSHSWDSLVRVPGPR